MLHTILYVFLCILGLIILLLLTAAVRALCIRRPAPAGGTPESPKDPERYAQSLAGMIRIETVSAPEDDPGKFAPFHAYLDQRYPNITAKLEKMIFSGCLLYHWKGTGAKDPLVLMAHMDVVAPGSGWTKDPFAGEISDGRVWGRGAVDTKSSLCAILEATEELLEEGYVPDREIYLAFGRDEEINGPGAARIMNYLKENGVRPECVIDEGGIILDSPIAGVVGRYAVIGITEKGYGDILFTVRGKGGHSSTPPRVTPVDSLARLITRITDRRPFRVRFSRPVREMFEAMVPYMEFKMRLIMGNLWLFGGLLTRVLPAISTEGAALLQTTCVFTVLSGSKNNNVIPGEASAVANLRYMPFQNMDESLKILRKFADRAGAEMKIIHGRPAAAVTDTRGKIYRSLEGIIRESFPEAGAGPYVMLGGTDGRCYCEICDNVLRFAPFYVDRQQYESIHSADENIFIDSLAKGVVFFKKVIRTLE